jgi:hypothetical protein
MTRAHEGVSVSAGRKQVRLNATEIVADRVFAATSSRVSAQVIEALDERSAVSGVVHVGPHAVTHCRETSPAGADLPRGVDLAAYERYQATSSAPLLVPAEEYSLISWSLADFVDGAAEWGADVVFTPSGRVRTGDSQALTAVIEAGNDARSPRVVTTVAVPQEWLTEVHRSDLLRGLRRSTRPVALVVIGQLDPYEDPEVAHGLLDVLDACDGQVFLHRTDMAAIEVLGRAGLGASIGLTTSLRHTVPPGRRAQKRRRSPRRRQPLHIFVPGISEFRDVAELEGWFGDGAPECPVVGCCGRPLTSFSHDPCETELLAVHNVRGWLELAEDLTANSPGERRNWLRQHHLQVETAYAELRAQTGVRAIRAYGSARVWSNLSA